MKLLGASVSGGEQGTVRWLYRTSSNLAIDQLRRRKRVAVGELRPSHDSSSPDAAIELRALVAHLAARVPANALQAALLSRANGLTQPELAQLLDVNERTIRRWLPTVDDAVQTLRSMGPFAPLRRIGTGFRRRPACFSTPRITEALPTRALGSTARLR